MPPRLPTQNLPCAGRAVDCLPRTRPWKRLVSGAALALLALLAFQTQARAAIVTVGFFRVNPANAPENVASQLNVDVLDQAQALSDFGVNIGATDVLFVFRNNVGIASSISEVYLDDGTIVAQSTIFNSLAGFTLFTGPGANPPDLPGGNNVSPPFVATAAFSADAQGNPSRGVDTSTDRLGIAYTTTGGFAGVKAALEDGTLRIGLHVVSIGSQGQSDAFVNNPPDDGGGVTPVPVPPSVLLMGLGGLGMLGFHYRPRRFRKA